VQLVMAAITTWPWSRSKRLPSSSWTGTRRLGRPLAPPGSGSNQPVGAGSWFWWVTPPLAAGGSLAGNDSADASSGPSSLGLRSTGVPGVASSSGAMSARAERKPRRASLRAIRSWGRRGPARLGTTVPRSSSTVSE
jgi:hypothetical protein